MAWETRAFEPDAVHEEVGGGTDRRGQQEATKQGSVDHGASFPVVNRPDPYHPACGVVLIISRAASQVVETLFGFRFDPTLALEAEACSWDRGLGH